MTARSARGPTGPRTPRAWSAACTILVGARANAASLLPAEIAVEEQGRRVPEPIGIVVGASHQHRALESGDEEARFLVRSAGKGELAAPPTRLEDTDQPALVGVEEGLQRAPHRGRQRAVLGGEHPAEAHPVLPENVAVQLDVTGEERTGVPFAPGEGRSPARRKTWSRRRCSTGWTCTGHRGTPEFRKEIRKSLKDERR